MCMALSLLIGACTLEVAAGFSLPPVALGVTGRGASGFRSSVLGLSGVTSPRSEGGGRRRGAFSPSIGGETPVILPKGGHLGQVAGRRGLAAPLQATQATDEEFKEMVLEGSSSGGFQVLPTYLLSATVAREEMKCNDKMHENGCVHAHSHTACTCRSFFRCHHRRLLGAMVRTLPDAQAGARGGGGRVQQ